MAQKGGFDKKTNTAMVEGGTEVKNKVADKPSCRLCSVPSCPLQRHVPNWDCFDPKEQKQKS